MQYNVPGAQRIVLTVGLPGSGKSTWLARRSIHAISSDEIRRLLADDPTDQTIHARVFRTARYLVRQRLAIGRPITYIDATNLTRADRAPYIQLARWRGAHIDALFFDVPLEECLRRNAARSRIVPPEVIRAMALKLQIPELSEGFRRITSVHDERNLDADAWDFDMDGSRDAPSSGTT